MESRSRTMAKVSPDLNRYHLKEGSSKISKYMTGSHQPLRCLGTTMDGCDWRLGCDWGTSSHRDCTPLSKILVSLRDVPT